MRQRAQSQPEGPPTRSQGQEGPQDLYFSIKAKQMVTHCPIFPGSLFPFYQFTANPAGTFWYHSHTAFQRDDGLSGIFVVRERDFEDAGCDLSEHVIHLQEWFRSPAKERYARGR